MILADIIIAWTFLNSCIKLGVNAASGTFGNPDDLLRTNSAITGNVLKNQIQSARNEHNVAENSLLHVIKMDISWRLKTPNQL